MFTDQIGSYLQTVNTAVTRQACQPGLAKFHVWYLSSHDKEPCATLLTKEVDQEWWSYLSNFKQLSAATVNQRLAALRGMTRYHGRPLSIKGIKSVCALRRSNY